jgi:AraC-like DNA-binding protein
MINVLEPQNELLKQFVDSIYIFRKSSEKLEFIAYPSLNTPVALFRNTVLSMENGHVNIENTGVPNHFGMACNQFSENIHLQYLQLVDEVAINFKPLGFPSFTQSRLKDEKVFSFHDWDKLLPDLLHNIFTADKPEQQLFYIEELLLERYAPLPDEAILLKALELLNDATMDYKMQEVAGLVGVHYKQLYRSFKENVGCSPAHYRKLVKFRTSVVSKIKKGSKARLIDICYNYDYTDQSYFIKQFKELTGEKPTHFFKEASSFGDDKVIFKIV